jgi:hypothetical protein
VVDDPASEGLGDGVVGDDAGEPRDGDEGEQDQQRRRGDHTARVRSTVQLVLRVDVLWEDRVEVEPV